MIKKSTWFIICFWTIYLALTFELFRDTLTKSGDFQGYIVVGNLTLGGENIYQTILNTWPPFFSIACVPIALLENWLGIYAIHFIWLSGLLFAFFKIINFTTKLTFEKKFWPFPKSTNISTISIIHPVLMIPILIILRYQMENMLNIQINIFILLMAVYSIYLFERKHLLLGGMILGLSISLKIITIFLLLYFVVKREFKFVGYTLLTVGICASLPFVIYGFDQTQGYYIHWYQNNIAPFVMVGHKNQSYFALIKSLLSHESPGLNGPLNEPIYLNFVDWSIGKIKLTAYGLLIVLGSGVVYMFQNPLKKTHRIKRLLEYAVILAITPILSPLSWKAYYIFLWTGYFMNYLFIFYLKSRLSSFIHHTLKIFFWISILLTVFSSEIFLGQRLSDIAESYYCVVFGACLVVSNLLMIYANFSKFDLSRIQKHILVENYK